MVSVEAESLCGAVVRCGRFRDRNMWVMKVAEDDAGWCASMRHTIQLALLHTIFFNSDRSSGYNASYKGGVVVRSRSLWRS